MKLGTFTLKAKHTFTTCVFFPGNKVMIGRTNQENNEIVTIRYPVKGEKEDYVRQNLDFMSDARNQQSLYIT